MRWSQSEKKIARRVYDTALETELAEIMAEFKGKAAAAATPDEMWELEGLLSRKRREIQEKYDYRYSQLILVFARLLQEGASVKINFMVYRKKSCRTLDGSFRCRSGCSSSVGGHVAEAAI